MKEKEKEAPVKSKEKSAREKFDSIF